MAGETSRLGHAQALVADIKKGRLVRAALEAWLKEIETRPPDYGVSVAVKPVGAAGGELSMTGAITTGATAGTANPTFP